MRLKNTVSHTTILHVNSFHLKMLQEEVIRACKREKSYVMQEHFHHFFVVDLVVVQDIKRTSNDDIFFFSLQNEIFSKLLGVITEYLIFLAHCYNTLESD